MSDNPEIKKFADGALHATFRRMDQATPKDQLALELLLAAHTAPEPAAVTVQPLILPAVIIPAPSATPAKKSRAKQEWKPNHRQRSILSIDKKLGHEAYSIELDKLEPWRDDWPCPWPKGTLPEDPHHQGYLAKGSYYSRLRSERYNTLKAAVLHGYLKV
jgi:hypothetical protein